MGAELDEAEPAVIRGVEDDVFREAASAFWARFKAASVAKFAI